MKKVSLVLALCAFIAAPAFADHTAAHTAATANAAGEPAAEEAAAANHTHKAPAKHGNRAKKMKKGKMHSEKPAPSEAAPEEATHE